MLYRIQAGRAENIEEFHAFGPGSGTEPVDVVEQQVIGVFVVTAKHDAAGILGQEIDQCLKVFGCRPFADENFHPFFDFFQAFFKAKALMIRSDTCSDVLIEIAARKPRGMAVNGLAVFMCQLQFFHYLRIFVDDPGIVHHFRQVENFILLQKFVNGSGFDDGPRGFK